MIISNLENNKIKIIADKTDLEKNNIDLPTFKSNPKKTLSFLKKLLNKSNNLSIKDFNIYTYQFKIYCIEIILNT